MTRKKEKSHSDFTAMTNHNNLKRKFAEEEKTVEYAISTRSCSKKKRRNKKKKIKEVEVKVEIDLGSKDGLGNWFNRDLGNRKTTFNNGDLSNHRKQPQKKVAKGKQAQQSAGTSKTKRDYKRKKSHERRDMASKVKKYEKQVQVLHADLELEHKKLVKKEKEQSGSSSSHAIKSKKELEEAEGNLQKLKQESADMTMSFKKEGKGRNQDGIVNPAARHVYKWFSNKNR